MRILIIQDYLRDGGTEQQTLTLCEHARRNGHEPLLLTFRPGGRLADRAGRAGVHLESLQSFDWRLNFFAPGLIRNIDRHAPDVILCMGRMANCYAGLLQKRFRHIPVVGSVRTGKRLPWFNLWSFRQLDAVIANSEWWREVLKARGLPASSIKVVGNALRASWMQRDRGEERVAMRKALGVAPSTVVFLNVASFRTRKRHAWLIESLCHLDPAWDWQLWLVGDGKEWRRCRRLLEGRRFRERVRLLGYQSDPYPYYAGADVGVSASVEDSLPNFLIEAQSAGLPVVASDFRGVGQTFCNGESGFLVPPQDRDQFLACVERLYLDQHLRESMGERGARFARTHFSCERQGAKVVTLFEQLIEARAVNPGIPSTPTSPRLRRLG